MVDICISNIRALIAAWLDASQRSWDGVWLNRSAREVKCKVLWAILRTLYKNLPLLFYCLEWNNAAVKCCLTCAGDKLLVTVMVSHKCEGKVGWPLRTDDNSVTCRLRCNIVTASVDINSKTGRHQTCVDNVDHELCVSPVTGHCHFHDFPTEPERWNTLVYKASVAMMKVFAFSLLLT